MRTPFPTSFRMPVGLLWLALLPALAWARSTPAPRPAASPAATVALTGTVFEDPNYGGGAGRPFSGTAGTSGRSGATVELYDNTGTYLANTTTAAGGTYAFSVTTSVTYQVRVVNSTVSSSRPGTTAGLLPVQTYAGLPTDANAVSRVGGAAPQLADAAANTSSNLNNLTSTSTTAQSVVQVMVGDIGVTNLNFGFCFDVVVNTNDSGQGSLRQFILNANALGGEVSLAQSGFSRSTTSTTGTALATGRETSIFMIPNGTARPGQLAGLVSGLTSQNGQLVAVIAMPAASSGYALVGGNAALTTVDGGTQTYNIGNTNAAVLGTGGSVGTVAAQAALSYTSFSGPEVQLLGVYGGSSKPSTALLVQADDFTLRNVAVRNFGNVGGQGAITLGNVPGRTGTLSGYTDAATGSSTGPQGPVRVVVENNVLGTDASSFTAPSPFTATEGDDGRNNQHVMVPVSGTSPAVNTLTVRTNLLGYSERRGIHIQGNASLTAGYNLNLSVYDNVFEGAGVAGQATGNVGPYQSSAAGAIELILLTTPFAEIYRNRITGPTDYNNPLYAGMLDGGSDGIQFNNATVVITGSSSTTPTANDRRDAGTAQPGSRVEQNTITQQRTGILCQSNLVAASYALDGLLIKDNQVTNNINGFYNQGASHLVQNNVFGNNQGPSVLVQQSGAYSNLVGRGMVNLGPLVTLTGNTFTANGNDGLLIGDLLFTASAPPTTAGYKPAVTGVVVGPNNVFSNNGTSSGTNGVGVAVINGDTRATLTRNSFYANASLSIDLANSNNGHDGVTANNGTLNAGFPNQEVDYPVVQRANLAGNVLTVVGYVGTAAIANSPFGNLPVEIYAADNTPANQNGQTIAGDNLSVAHGEGRTYLGTLTTAADGSFNGSITLPAGTTLTTSSLVTGLTTIGSGATASTSEFGSNVQVSNPNITGYVFEDVNYGGGSGRPRTAAGTSPRPGATVELYNAAGAFVATTTTDAAGFYSFPQTVGTYTVRVVNSTVTSSRPGYAAGVLPVQTYNGTTTRVGGESPAKADAGANTAGVALASLTSATATAQSLGAVTASSLSGPDFGFNFDLVVNTNDSGQGSLRQFLTNANTLGGEGSLAQSGVRTDSTGTVVSLPAGKETSIFMITDGNAHPGLLAYSATTNAGLASQLTGTVALITTTSKLTLSGTNGQNTNLDGSTQTANIGNNAGVAANATAATVGVKALTLSAVRQASVEVQATGVTTLLDVEVPNATVRSLALHGADADGTSANNQVVLVGNDAPATGYLFESVLVGTAANGLRPGLYASNGYGINLKGSSGVGTVVHSLVAFNGNSGLNVNNGTGTMGINVFSNNFIQQNGFLDGGGDGITFGDGGGSGPAKVAKNLFQNQNSSGIQFEIGSTSTNTVVSNTITGSGVISLDGAGVSLEGSGIDYLLRNANARGSQADVIQNNVISGSQTAGVLVGYGQQNVTITQNNISNNGRLGIDLIANPNLYVGSSANTPTSSYGDGDGVTTNDGNSLSASGNGLPNKGVDFPVLGTANISGSTLTVTGFSRPGAVVEFFIRDTDATGFGEGQLFLASLTEGSTQDGDPGTGSYGLTTSGPPTSGTTVNSLNQGNDGLASKFTFTFSVASLTVAQRLALTTNGLTATATLSNNTSEYSGKVPVTTTPLPVSLTVFTAQAVRNQDGLLKWATATETDNDHFDVERSFDGRSFVKIGVVAGQGTKLTATEYSLTDAGVAAKATGPVYYRLRQVDLSGAATYSPVRSISFTATGGSVALYPTLTGGSATLDLSLLPATNSYQVLLTDMTGRTVRAWTLAGGQAQTLNVTDAAPGIYHLLVTGTAPDNSALRQSLRLTRE